MAWVIASSLRASGRRGAYPAFFFFLIWEVSLAPGDCVGMVLAWCGVWDVMLRAPFVRYRLWRAGSHVCSCLFEVWWCVMFRACEHLFHVFVLPC